MKRFSGLRNIGLAILILITITLIGIAGYCFIENYSLLDAIYMTVITIATVGYEEVHPLSGNGKIFTILLIVFSWGTFAYAISVVTSHFISLNLRDTFHMLKTISRIKKMKNHIIICGYGRNGQQTVNELLAYHQDFVVIEQNKVLVDENKEKINIIQGDSTTDETLIEAGVQHARALITALPIDADNLFVALTARALNPDILIVSRATHESSEKKLRIAGVNHVIFPEKVGGTQMAVLVSHPDVVEFLNHLSIHGSSPTNLEEIDCGSLHKANETLTIKDLGFRKAIGINIIGFKTPSGEFVINPMPDTILVPDSKLFVLGTKEQVMKMKEILANYN